MKPILFNTEMVCAILDGLKTVTRRPIKPHYRPDESGFQIITDAHTGAYVRIEYYDEWENETRIMTDPYQCGDILYVRETWAHPSDAEVNNGADPQMYLYKADIPKAAAWDKWRPSIHMPREAARLFLRVADVRAERLQDIMQSPPGPDNQVVKEGLRYGCDFIAVWDSTIKPADRALYGWDANPWVWVIEFERISKEAANDCKRA